MKDPVDGMTERLLADAGIGPGMRVLDVGCGGGIVTLMAARLVGPGGHVVGLDRDPRPLAAARERAAEAGLAHVEFREGDLHAPPGGPYDAVVGRRVLMYQPDPVAALRALASVLRPGGIMACHEHDMTMSGGLASLPLHERVHGWKRGTVESEGADIRLGFKLASLLARAGLVTERVRSEAIVETPTQPHMTGKIVRLVLPRLVAAGVATEAEIDVETLDARLAEELTAADATYIGELVFTAWARKPTG